jgi:hypothetical protein
VKKLLAVLVAAALFLVPINAIAAVKAGDVCKKVGTTATANGKKFTCIKSGKKLIWNKGVALLKSKPAETPTPMPTPTPEPTSSGIPTPVATPSQTSTPSPARPLNTNVITEASRYVQSIVSDSKLNTSDVKPSVFLHIEAGKNGNYPSIAEQSIKKAINFYWALGFKLPQPEVHVILGRTQVWMHKQAKDLAPNCVAVNYVFSGNASLCATAKRAVVYSHLPTAITSASRTPDDVNLENSQEVLRYTNQNAIEQYWRAMPHEVFHSWQDGMFESTRLAAGTIPAWLWEGAAQFFSAMALASEQNQPDSYLLIDPTNWSPGSWDKSTCNTKIENLKPVCEYTQGAVAFEYFVYKFGLETYRTLIITSKDRNFETNFKVATKVDLMSFYLDLNEYLIRKGWTKL